MQQPSLTRRHLARIPWRRPRLWAVAALLALILVACRRDEPPAPTPTAARPTATLPDKPTAPPPTEEPTPGTSGGLTAVDPANIDWSPRVVYSSPAPGEEALLNGAITLRFDQPMDQPSVEAALMVADLAEPGQTAPGEFSWVGADTLIFTPESHLKRATRYRVQIADTARGANGLTLEAPIELELQTVGFLDIGQVLPGPETREVQTDGAITVLFNRPVVPLVATAQQADLPQPLTISPALPGTGQWVSTSIYRFVPDGGFAGATTYNVTVAAGLTDITGGVLEKDFAWQFTTVSPSVVSVIPAQQQRNVVPTEPITVTFNMPMDQAATAAAISLQASGDGRSPALSAGWSDDGRTVTLTLSDQLSLATNYVLTIGQGARSQNGAATLDREVVRRFTTVPFPSVAEVHPRQGERVPFFSGGVSIQFASPMDPATLVDRVIITPAPERVRYNLGDEPIQGFFIEFEMEPRTEYQVTVPASAADPYGNTLGEAFTWRFWTEGQLPLVALNLPPGRLGQLSTLFPSQVEIGFRNVSRLDLSLYDLGLPAAVLIEPGRVTYDYNPTGTPRTWTVDVAQSDAAAVYTLDLADGGVLPTGVYLLQARAPQLDRDSRFWQNQRSLLLVADTNLVVKQTLEQVHVWATDLATGQPAANRPLVLYNEVGRRVAEATTNQNGLASFSYRPAMDYLEGVLVVAGTAGQPGFGAAGSAWSPGVDPWQFGLGQNLGQEPPFFAYIFTDRPIYRPGDTIFFRGLVRRPIYGRYQVPEPFSVTMVIEPYFYDPNAGEPTRQSYTLDARGGFSGEFTIPEGMALGVYGLRMEAANHSAGTTVTVAEYRKPEFQVSVTPDRTEALRGDTIDITIEASYFFGGPATDLPVEWSVRSSEFFFSQPGPFYSFAEQRTFFYDPYGFGPFGFGGYLMGGQGQTDGEGRLVVTLPAALLKDVPEGGRTIIFEASIRDLSEFPVSARTEVTFHPAETYVGIAPRDYLGTVGLANAFDLLTVDWDGEPVAGTAVEVVFNQREWEPVRQESFGSYFTTWEAVDTEVSRARVTTDGQGKGTASFVPARGGTYYVTATITDAGGRRQRSAAYLWVADAAYSGWRSDPVDRRMDLVADRQEYGLGDTARILVQSPFAGPVRAWLTIERGLVLEQRVITLNSGSETVEIPITSDFAPNAFVTVVAVQGADPAATRYADIRLGLVELNVRPEQFALDIQITPRQDLLEPRDTAVFDIQVTDYQGRPVRADLSLALVDLAVLSLKSDDQAPILAAFYERQPIRSRTGGGLFFSGEGLTLELPEQIGGFGGGGGNGEAAVDASLVLREEAAGDDTVRQDFRDTAYWEAVVTTGAAGTATVEIPLPDNLTTWRLRAKAATSDTLVGQTTTDIVVTKPLLVRPVTPRFFTVGDVAELGAVVNNNTGSAQDVVVSLEAGGVAVNGAASQTIQLGAGRSQLVRWTVTVADVEFVDLTFRVRAGAFSDASKPTAGRPGDRLIPVFRYNAEDVVGTSGVVAATGRRVEAILLPENLDPGRGEVVVRLSPSLAAALTDALEFNVRSNVPAECPYIAADRLLANTAYLGAFVVLEAPLPIDKATLDERITSDISLLNRLVLRDGGWGWCFTGQSDPYLSAHVLLALSQARAAGYRADESVVQRGLTYLQRQITEASRLPEAAWAVNRQAFFLYVLSENGVGVAPGLDDLFTEHRALLDPYARALMILAYARSGIARGNIPALLADLNDAVVLSATGAHWEDREQDYDNLSSDIRGTALAIAALATVAPDNALAPQAVRWLMSARRLDHWPSSHENAWSIRALTEWLKVSGDLAADYNYSLVVNGAAQSSGRFSRENLADSSTLALPLRRLVPEAVNFLDFRAEGAGRLYYTTHLDAFVDARTVQPVSRGVTVQRAYYDAACDPTMEECQPLSSIGVGQRVRVQLNIIAPHDLTFVTVRDPLPAGAEGLDPNLETTASDTQGGVVREDFRYGYWGWWFFNRIEFRDEQVVFFSNFLPAGTYQYTYFLDPLIPGEYQVMPAVAQEVFFPEVFGRSEGMVLTITR